MKYILSILLLVFVVGLLSAGSAAFEEHQRELLALRIDSLLDSLTVLESQRLKS